MTEEQARRLLPMTIVMWDGNPNDLGTVREIGLTGFLVDWANGETGWIDFRGAAKVATR